MRTVSMLLLLALVGCTGQQAASPAKVATRTEREPTSAPENPARAWTIIPLKGTWKAAAIEITSDGEIVVDGRVHARFVGNDVQDAAGKTLIHGTPEGELTIEHPPGSSADFSNRVRFDGQDRLIMEAGGRVRISDDGAVTWMSEDEPVLAPLHIEGFTPVAKREVLLLFLILMRDY